MSNTLYISDVDFTLLSSDRTLSEFSRRSLNDLLENGVKFTVATARSIYSLSPLLGDINFRLPIIEFNGGYITDYKTKSPYHLFDIDQHTTKRIRDIGIEFGLYPLISGYNDSQQVFPPEKTNSAYIEYLNNLKTSGDPRLMEPTPFHKILNSKIMSLTFMGHYGEISKIRDLIDTNISTSLHMHFYENKYTPSTYWLTIHGPQSSKEHAIQQLISDHKLEDYETVVFGDDVNDIGMFKVADRSIAVRNAKEEVKDHADEIIGTNDQDAVVNFILENEKSI